MHHRKEKNHIRKLDFLFLTHSLGAVGSDFGCALASFDLKLMVMHTLNSTEKGLFRRDIGSQRSVNHPPLSDQLLFEVYREAKKVTLRKWMDTSEAEEVERKLVVSSYGRHLHLQSEHERR